MNKNRISFNRFLATVAFTMLGLLLLPVANTHASHPYPVSNAEVNFNAKTGNFEVALNVWPSDLEKALGQAQKTIVDLDKTENLDDLLKSYIEKRFLVRPEASTSQASDSDTTVELPSIRWIGHERNLKSAWLYFEIECDAPKSNWIIENRGCFEMNEDQLNQLEISAGKTSRIVVCRSGESRFKFETVAKE